MSFISYNDYGIIEIDKILNEAYAVALLDNQELNSSGYVAVSINKNETYAVSNAESIILENNSAGTIDVTIISNA